MLSPRYIPLVTKLVVRHPARSALTVLGVATAMFLFATIQSIQAGLRAATEASAKDNELIVYRKDRFCPFTSRLPEHYEPKIARIDGVERVTPTTITVSNCRASLDVVTFRGVPKTKVIDAMRKRLRVLSGSLDDWSSRSDAALVGVQLAERRQLRPGMSFKSGHVQATVAAVVDSDSVQDRNVAYVDLDFIQQTPGQMKDGIVTQFNVIVQDPAKMNQVAAAIDAQFAAAEEPTETRSEKAHVARAAGDLLELVGFTHYVGLGCAIAVLALVGNAIVLAVQGRVKDHATMQCLGFPGHLIARLILAEGLITGLIGGAVGTAGAVAFLRWGSFSLSNEGLSINLEVGPEVWLGGLLASVLLGVLAGLVPAIQASRREITDALRAI